MAGIEWMRSREIETENGYVKETEFRLTSKLNLHARTLGTTINETVQTAGVESILAIIYTVANGKDRVYFGPAAR